MCNNNTDCKCISDILKVICILQKNAVCHDDCEDVCDRKTLGRPNKCEFNTRPIQLFTCGFNGNDPLIMPTTKGPITPSTCFSSTFRVEKVDDCCATCRVLVEEVKSDLESHSHNRCPEFIATDSFFTIDLKCVCIVKCLEDTFVDCI
ncbi:MAG: CotY/CotZ family spore coat protein [Bacilli bacterium]|nr:CotY/CotZ family spore coat protein [Bacilli bacterium]MDD3304531.1 CotY/CotZ family spore coat protein [Bacilli bacterium]MDD4053911.1 CotY/CotZ family spore coat protein [Bacilli bacterium]MDD4411280.1 CotY/CotZ family spore coat protein [Bacilli bacterium]